MVDRIRVLRTPDTMDGDSGGPMFALVGSDPRVIGVVSGVASEIIGGVNHIMASGVRIMAIHRLRVDRTGKCNEKPESAPLSRALTIKSGTCHWGM